MVREQLIIFVCILFIIPGNTVSQSAYSNNKSVRVSVIAESFPPRIVLTWPSHPDAVSYSIFRKNKNDQLWGSAVATLPANSVYWDDLNVSVGDAY
jgi:hypothetical protein